MDYLYGELNQNLVNLANYKGLDNGDARVLVDNTERTIGVDLGGLKDSIASSYVSTTKDQEVGGTKTFTDDIAVMGTTKLTGGFEPIKSYTVNADYKGRQTTLVLNVFTENYVESRKMYSFFGSASATALGVGEFICNGSYRLDTNGNLDGAVLLTTMKQDIGSLIMVCQYENGQLIAVSLADYDDIESVQTWANGTFAQLGNPNNFTGSSNVFNGSLITNGTLKLKGGFEPIKTYTVEGTYEENPLSVTLDIFTEKRGVVDSDSNPPTTTYSFYGSANAPALGGEAIGQGVYFLNTNNNKIYSLLFVCGLNTYFLDGDTGEFKFDTIPQGTGVDNYVENYVKNTLDGMLSKDSSGKIAVGRGITVEADGNVAVKKSLEVSETTKLMGGIEPIKSYTAQGQYKTNSGYQTLPFTLSIFAEAPLYGPNGLHYNFLGSVDILNEKHFCNGVYSLDGEGNLHTIGCSITDIKTGDANITKCTYFNGEIRMLRVADYHDVENWNDSVMVIQEILKKMQPKLYPHTLTLTADKSYTLVYQSTDKTEVISVEKLRTIMNVALATDNVILPVCATDLSGTAVLQVTTSVCKIGTADVTAVSDSVPADATGE